MELDTDRFYLSGAANLDNIVYNSSQDLSKTPTMFPLPLDPPSRDDWNLFKDIIIEQYISNNMALKDLVRYMESNYTFTATERMFKQRFNDWNIFKYRRAAERRMTRSGSTKSSRRSNSTTGMTVVRSSSATSACSSPVAAMYPDSYTSPSPTSSPACHQASSCTHRECVQAFLFDLALRADESTDEYPTMMGDSSFSARTFDDAEAEVLHHVRTFSLSWLDPDASSHNHHIVNAAAQAKQLTSNIAGHCSHKTSANQCERCTWSEFAFGLAMLEEGHSDLAWTSFHLGCRLASFLLSSPSKLFIRNLIMAFGSPRWQQFQELRNRLLNYLAMMSAEILGDEHSITIILKHISRGDALQQCARSALEIMIEVAEMGSLPAHPDILLIKRSLSVILRRAKQYEQAEKVLLSAVHQSEYLNGSLAKETRRCLRRLGHLYMEQCRWDEAEATFMRILDSAPGKDEYKDTWIPDEISVYTYQHLAKMFSDIGDSTRCRYWLSQELMAAISRWGTHGEYTTECLQLAYNETSPEGLVEVVEQYPEVLVKAESMFRTGKLVISKARWCAVRNLI